MKDDLRVEAMKRFKVSKRLSARVEDLVVVGGVTGEVGRSEVEGHFAGYCFAVVEPMALIGINELMTR